ncbi:MAG: hypothetical protein V3S24_20005, partial [Candidatus Tectomicrobia bacterium]
GVARRIGRLTLNEIRVATAQFGTHADNGSLRRNAAILLWVDAETICPIMMLTTLDIGSHSNVSGERWPAGESAKNSQKSVRCGPSARLAY